MRDLEHANEIKTALEGLGSVALPVKTAGDSRQAVRFGHRRRRRRARSRRPAARTWTSGPCSLPKAHIKAIGTHTVAVQLHPEVNVDVSVNVVAE